MRIVARDIKLLRDLALSHLLSRDQIIQLGYYGSITRLNFRIKKLIEVGYIQRLNTPLFSQSLYAATKKASEIIGENVAPLLESRIGSPRYLQHALTLSSTRIALIGKTGGDWRFEQQLWRKVDGHEIRPDGLLLASSPTFVEVDMGHMGSSRFRAKLAAYQALALSGSCQSLYGFKDFRLLAVTTGSLRARHLRQLCPSNPGFEYRVQTFAEIGVAPISPFS